MTGETLPNTRRCSEPILPAKLLEKTATLMAKEMPSEADLVSLKDTLEQLARKKDKLKDPDERIAALLGEPDEIEKEAFETEDMQDNIAETSWQMSSFLGILTWYLLRKPLTLYLLILRENHYVCLMEIH